VDFGAFVDIGLHDTGLVHISQLANKYVRDPHEVVSVGDIVKVWVHEIDKTRRRVSLTMIAPGTQRTSSQRGGAQRSGAQRPPRDGAAANETGEGTETVAADATAGGAAGARHDRPPAQQGGRPQGRGGRGRGGPYRGGQNSSGQNAAGQGQGGAGHAAAGRGGAGHGGGQGRPGKPKYQSHAAPAKPARPAKPVKPLTPKMKEGKEPLRTFGDLKQFFELKKDDDQGIEETTT
ncbi:MAG TPA: S1 RNA-binding domain-containing protein, partial [Pirellulales bacterium]|nr:S1 RNA-binding domain-containing protein [Pirellulales bacterium]